MRLRDMFGSFDTSGSLNYDSELSHATAQSHFAKMISSVFTLFGEKVHSFCTDQTEAWLLNTGAYYFTLWSCKDTVSRRQNVPSHAHIQAYSIMQTLYKALPGCRFIILLHLSTRLHRTQFPAYFNSDICSPFSSSCLCLWVQLSS